MSEQTDSTVYMASTARAYVLNTLHTAAVNYYRTTRDLAKSASQERQYVEAGMRPLGIGHKLLAEASAHHAAYISMWDVAQSVLRGDGMEYSEIDAVMAIAADPTMDVYFLLEK